MSDGGPSPLPIADRRREDEPRSLASYGSLGVRSEQRALAVQSVVERRSEVAVHQWHLLLLSEDTSERVFTSEQATTITEG